MADCYVCQRPWVEWSTLCGEDVCSEQCGSIHQAWCSWCTYVHFNTLKDPRIEPIPELHKETP